MATATAKAPKKRPAKKSPLLPPSADVAKIAGRDFVIMPLEDFSEWQEDLALAALMAERLEDGEPYISFEELERHLDKKSKGRKK